MNDDYYRQRHQRRIAAQEAAAENARAARFLAADEALRDVLYLDSEVIESGEDRDTLSRARAIILDLRETW